MPSHYSLGISAYAHDSSCALLRDGKLVAMAEEERFNRKKHTMDFPVQAIRFCLNREGISIEDISDFSFFWQPWLELRGNLAHFLRFFPSSLNLLNAPSGGDLKFLERLGKMFTVASEIQSIFHLNKKPHVRFVEHHLSHAASTFYLSGFEEAAILTIDGRGESTSTMFSHGGPKGIEKLLEIRVPHSVGHFYAAVTQYLGFRPFFEEWKVMGMSAYGTDRYVEDFSDLIHWNVEGTYQLNLDYFSFHSHGQKAWLSHKFFEKFGSARDRAGDYGQHEFDIAFALQRTVERLGISLARRLKEITGLKHLCVAGGVSLNCLMNREILGKSGFESVFFQPVANDAGTSLGAALFTYNEKRLGALQQKLEHVYFGPEFSNQEIEIALKASGVNFRFSEDVFSETAGRIAQGKIVGWFQGRMESGPRALGNRSILVDPRRAEMKDKLNANVKRRESFRPFAPSILAEKCSEYFELPGEVLSPYMMLIGNVRPEKKDRIPAVTHADGTARIQTVSENENPRFWRLIKEFEKLSGVPVLLNTSFNENEPIVCTPEDAVRCFLRTNFDVLAIGDYLVEKVAEGDGNAG